MQGGKGNVVHNDLSVENKDQYFPIKISHLSLGREPFHTPSQSGSLHVDSSKTAGDCAADLLILTRLVRLAKIRPTSFPLSGSTRTFVG